MHVKMTKDLGYGKEMDVRYKIHHTIIKNGVIVVRYNVFADVENAAKPICDGSIKIDIDATIANTTLKGLKELVYDKIAEENSAFNAVKV